MKPSREIPLVSPARPGRVRFIFALFCLGFGLVAPPAALADTMEENSLGGTDTVINTDRTGHNVHGNNNRSNPTEADPNKPLTHNNLTINSPARLADAYGAKASGNHSVTDNSVTVNGGTMLSVNGGYLSGGHGNATHNSVTVNGGTISGSVYGGWLESSDGNMTGNSVTVNGGTMGSVSGAFLNSGDGNLTSNTVNVSGGTMSNVYGAYHNSGDGNATGNTVNISVGTVNSAIGGYILDGSGSAVGNTVNIHSGLVNTTVHGGYATGVTGNAVDNTVNISGGTVNREVYGGRGGGNVTGNTVNVSGGRMNNTVYGGFLGNGDGNVSGNTVHVSVGTVNSAIGGYIGSSSGNGSLIGNTVHIYSGSVNTTVYGAYHGSGGGDVSGNTVSGNTVSVFGGTVGGGIYGGYFASDGAGNAVNNIVNIEGGTVSSVYGGYFASGAAGNAVNNTVNIKGGTVNSVYGAYRGSGGGNVSGNTVNVAGGTLNSVYGGFIINGGGSATGNTVNISGGSVNGSIYGGYRSSSSTGGATHNTVNISGHPIFGPSVGLFGGSGSAASDVRTGNTLNLQTQTPVTVASARNFEHWNFYLPAGVGAGGTMLSVTGLAALGANAKVGMGISGFHSPLQRGESMYLIDADTLTGTLANTTATVLGGVTLEYEIDLLADTANGFLIASVRDVDVNEQTKALNEGFLSDLALTNQGADLVAGKGLAEAVRAGVSADYEYGLGIFGFLSGGWSRYNTGSHVDVSGLTFLTGLSKGLDFEPGRLTLGAFFEYGEGSYDIYNSFGNAASVHGHGDIRHLGGGLIGRLDFAAAGPGHIYTEASLRAGGLHNEYRSDLRDSLGREAEYGSNSPYYGFHLGSGYVWNITDKADLDLYGKYFWTRVEGDSVRLSTGDPVSFKDADSSRPRGGARLSYAVNEYVSPYVGAAYEYEFAGRSQASTSGYAIEAPSLRGGTGLGELGLTFKPSATLPLSFDLGLEGYAGKREGLTGSLQVRYEF